MKIQNLYINMHTFSNNTNINDVPYWKTYIVQHDKLKHTRKIITKYILNFTLDELIALRTQLGDLNKLYDNIDNNIRYTVECYPRKYQYNKKDVSTL